MVKTPVMCAGAAPEGGTVMENFLKLKADIHLPAGNPAAPNRLNVKEATPGRVMEKPRKTRGKRQTLKVTRRKIMCYL